MIKRGLFSFLTRWTVASNVFPKPLTESPLSFATLPIPSRDVSNDDTCFPTESGQFVAKSFDA